MEVPMKAMLDWLERQTAPEALAIRDRMRQDAAVISDLENDRDEYARQVKELKALQAEAAWQTR